MDPLEPNADGERYLAGSGALLRLLASAEGAESVALGGACAVVSGIGSNCENGVVGTLRVGVDREERIAALIAFVRRHDVPGSWLFVQPPDAGDDLADALVSNGCRSEGNAWVMGGPIPARVPDAEGAQIAVVGTAAGLEDWLTVAGTCGWIETPRELAVRRRVYGSLPFDGPWRRWVAMQDGTPVGMAAALVASNTLYLTDSAVIPEARRRGIGRALALTRLRFGADSGCTRAVLAPSPDGAQLWRGLGFVESRQPRDRWFYLPSPMRAGLDISRAEEDESEAILALHREAGWPGTHLAGEVWAVREAGRVVGSAQFIELAPALVLIDAVVVGTSERDRGVGTELMRTALTGRAAQWWLECSRERLAFYQRLGFVLANEADVPLLIKGHVGGNPRRQQHFLHRSTITSDEARAAP